jgi:hypothetical protein
MSIRKPIVIGAKFHRWAVVGDAPSTPRGHAKYLCRCECGAIRSVDGIALRKGHTKSCGCYKRDITSLRRKSHGHTVNGKVSRAYASWRHMLQRCYDQNIPNFKNWGGRGILVCERWRLSFENFLKDMGEPLPDTTLDRFPDNDGNYEPGNCRWATHAEQAKNTRRNRYLTFNGQRRALSEWARIAGIGATTLRRRMDDLHWPLEKALSTDV